MARRGDEDWAFELAKTRKPTGRWTITVIDFLRELQKVGFDWSPSQANDYIRYISLPGASKMKAIMD
ncbi:hypothetical protein HP475_10120 [Serratia marcescens]|uniref:hypothetical protein n=1 Tax=Serratia marcescens TaxID=615 RepID=UPI0015D78DD5|nr:hypothetical protein [Serratia marcescens]QLJ60254.1 hypothetical protein HP475_10120 [Serratia marcescens]